MRHLQQFFQGFFQQILQRTFFRRIQPLPLPSIVAGFSTDILKKIPTAIPLRISPENSDAIFLWEMSRHQNVLNEFFFSRKPPRFLFENSKVDTFLNFSSNTVCNFWKCYNEIPERNI